MSRDDLIKQAVREAGRIVLQSVPSEGVIQKEGQANIVTAADFASEKAIVTLIKKNFPNDAILSEETLSELDDPLSKSSLWVIDPIDGTNNFRYQRNYSAVSVGYLENGIPQIGAAHNPFTNEFYFAARGKGAFLNDKKIHVSNQTDITKASIGTGNQYDHTKARRNFELLLKLPKLAWVLIRGSAVLELCEIASAKIDLFFHNGMRPWDNAAAFLLIEEAGGVIKDFKGKNANILTSEKEDVVTGNPKLVEEFLRIVNK